MEKDILVNMEHPLDENFVPEKLENYTEYNGVKKDETQKTLVDSECLAAFKEMQRAALKDDVHLVIDSAYRSFEYQQKLYQMNPVYAAAPGTSEHQTGLALDLALYRKKDEVKKKNDNDDIQRVQNFTLFIDLLRKRTIIDEQGLCYVDDYEDTSKESQWLIENSYKFGFVLRYPKGYEEITNIPYEHWHYRYIGKEAALYMHDYEIKTLEEYTKMHTKTLRR